MIDPELHRRIRKVENQLAKSEKIISDEQKKRAARAEARKETLRPLARHHATAIAAIVLFGNPQISEPLINAWRRALRCLKDEHRDEVEYEYTPSEHDVNGMRAYYRDSRYVEDCRKLHPIIIKDANESNKFAEIFAAAPIWLLNFTNVALDALILNFSLPPNCNKKNEGRKFWPYIPFGKDNGR